MMLMLVAVTQRNDPNKYGKPMDNLNTDYLQWLHSSGHHALLIPNVKAEIEYYVSSFPIRAVIFTGGNDIHPSLYDSSVGKWPGASRERDAAELELLRLAVQRKIPVLGICRGMQLINVYFGGKLVKDIKEEITERHPPSQNHPVELIDDRAIAFLGKRRTQVNSFHNQAVVQKTLAPALRVFALSPEDGIMEGLYHPELPIAGIQWHPERESPDKEMNRKLAEAFKEGKLFWKKS